MAGSQTRMFYLKSFRVHCLYLYNSEITMVKIKGEVVEETINQSRVIVYFWGNCSGVEILFQAFKSAPLKRIV